MAKPPPTPPSSDLLGVNRDARVNASPGGNSGTADALQDAHEDSKARPDETAPLGGSGGGRDE